MTKKMLVFAHGVKMKMSVLIVIMIIKVRALTVKKLQSQARAFSARFLGMAKKLIIGFFSGNRLQSGRTLMWGY